MSWKPIAEDELRANLRREGDALAPEQLRLWEAIRVPPTKWQLPPWGDAGGGFWVVAVMGRTVVWYNDIEDGFNRSTYTTHGVIDEYGANQDELRHAVDYLLERVQSGCDSGPRLGAPEPIR